jgi:hypothetical protein
MCLSNIDGTGRQVQIICTPSLTIVRAGCFRGSVEEFAKKARDEGKLIYAAVIPAVAAAFRGI